MKGRRAMEGYLGPYQLQEQIGQGATSEVYLARDTRLDRLVAVKILCRPAAESPEYLTRLGREARSAARLSHPNIVAVYDLGQEAGVCYLVMEYVEGETLRQVLDQERLLSLGQSMEIAIQACRGLAHAHQRGVVHGDLKPGNLLLTRDGVVKIADFGLAQELRQASPGEPASGTLLYMAPERLAGAQGDERADLYALGALLYELLAGRPPFSGTKTIALIQSHLIARPAPLRPLRPEVPLWFEQLVLRLLEKEPAQRHRSAAEVLQVLEEGRQHLRAERARRSAGEHWPLVGREAELAVLKQVLEELKAGRDGLILVEGEAGIGKTHLLEELAGTETTGEVRWLWGQGQETTPYGAFAQVLREALGVGPDDSPAAVAEKLRGCLRGKEAEGWLPALSQLLSPASWQGEGGAPLGAAGASRQQLFWGVWQLLAGLATAQPLVLLLDDLHLADLGTVELLDFIARQLGQARLLVAGTYRPEELGQGAGALQGTIRDLEKLGWCRRLELRRLPPQETGRLAMAFLGGSPLPADLSARLQQETEGHPLFVLETLKWMQQEGLVQQERGGYWTFRETEAGQSWLPPSLQQAIRSRFAQLEAQDQEILRCAAVEGERFSSEALGCVLGIGRLPLLRSLDRLEHRHRMVHYEGARYRFDHAKIREVLSAEVSPELRRELHLLLAQYKEDRHQDQLEAVVFELAEHFYEAGGQEKAQHYLVRAGDQVEACTPTSRRSPAISAPWN